MADNIQLDEGSSGKYAATEEVSSNIHVQKFRMQSISAAGLYKAQVKACVTTLTNADTNYAASGTNAAIPSGYRYVVVYCASPCVVAMGEATSATVGVYVGAGAPTVFPVLYTGTTADDTPNFQSSTAGAVVRHTWLKDL